MKRKWYGIGCGLLLLLMATLMSCATASVQYGKMDPALPSAEQALLYIHKDTFIRVFDGQNGVMGSGQMLPWVYIVAPGKHEFSVDYGHPYILVRGLQMSNTFEPGRFYYLYGERKGNEAVVTITDETDSTDPELVKIRDFARENMQ